MNKLRRFVLSFKKISYHLVTNLRNIKITTLRFNKRVFDIIKSLIAKKIEKKNQNKVVIINPIHCTNICLDKDNVSIIIIFFQCYKLI